MKEILIFKESKTKQISNARDLFKQLKKIEINYHQENMIVVYLNTKNEVLGSDVLFKGGLDCCSLDSKTLFRNALINNSRKIIIAHNHPSGDLKPSYEDKEVFRELQKAGSIIDLPIIDSIIFNEKEFYSMEEMENK